MSFQSNSQNHLDTTSRMWLIQDLWPSAVQVTAIILADRLKLFNCTINFRCSPKLPYYFFSIIYSPRLSRNIKVLETVGKRTDKETTKSYLAKPAWAINSKLHTQTNNKTRDACNIHHRPPPEIYVLVSVSHYLENNFLFLKNIAYKWWKNHNK
jgi:hypothetical protein